ARRPWRLAASGGLPWAGLQLRLMTLRVGVAISALFYLGKGGTTPEHVAVIKKALSPEDLSKLVACRMPKWMRAALETT
ncbi:hypothetical protein N0003_29135, partial [Pseudomonas aeruginosa]|nr:hypothetical protein [Pseudomonas aeruginosa]